MKKMILQLIIILLYNHHNYLYDGCKLTVSSNSVLVMKFKQRHNPTDEGLADLLQLIRLHCPVPNSCPTSVYYFKKQFSDFKYPTTLHQYCSKCLTTLQNGAKQTVCPNTYCCNDCRITSVARSTVPSV